MHLRMSALPSAAEGSGSESLSQLQRISDVTLLPVYIQSQLLSSCSHCLCGQIEQLRCWVFGFFFFLFALLSLLIISVNHATVTQSYSVFQREGGAVAL